jgi:hypothetical protein
MQPRPSLEAPGVPPRALKEKRVEIALIMGCWRLATRQRSPPDCRSLTRQFEATKIVTRPNICPAADLELPPLFASW